MNNKLIAVDLYGDGKNLYYFLPQNPKGLKRALQAFKRADKKDPSGTPMFTDFMNARGYYYMTVENIDLTN